MQERRQVLFVQGAGKGVHDEWDDKLVESLQKGLGHEYEVHYPRMPNEHEPSYSSWKAALAGVFETLAAGAVVVGHSLGGTMLLKALTEPVATRKLAGLVLIAAPFVGAGGWSATDSELPADLAARLPKGVPIHFFHGLEDETAPVSHVHLYARAIPGAHIHRLSGRDHRLNDNLTEVAAVIRKLG